MERCLLSRKEKEMEQTIDQQLAKKYYKSVKLHFLLLFVCFFLSSLFVCYAI